MKKSGLIATLAAGMILLSACGSGTKTIDAAALASSLATDISYDDTLEKISDEDVSMLRIRILLRPLKIMYRRTSMISRIHFRIIFRKNPRGSGMRYLNKKTST